MIKRKNALRAGGVSVFRESSGSQISMTASWRVRSSGVRVPMRPGPVSVLPFATSIDSGQDPPGSPLGFQLSPARFPRSCLRYVEPNSLNGDTP